MLWVLESKVALPGCPCCLRFCNFDCMVGGIPSSFNDLPDAALLRSPSFLWLPFSTGLSHWKTGRWWRSVEGEDCRRCCCWWWWFGCSHWFVSLLCLSLPLATPPLFHSLSSLHFTLHTHACTHTGQDLGKLHKAETLRAGEVNLFPLHNSYSSSQDISLTKNKLLKVYNWCVTRR